jgi:hypothetical protein
VRKKHFKTNWQVDHPLRAFGRGFAALSLLFCVTTPFVNDLPSRWLFLFGGFGYSAFLSFFAIGICLLPLSVRTRVFTFLFTLQALCFAVGITILFLARSGALAVIRSMLTPSLWALGVAGVGLLAFAFYGWYFRLTNDSTKVAS